MSRPPGISLLFASAAEIAAAPAEEREAYLRIVEGLLADPEAAGFQRDGNTLTAVDSDIEPTEDALEEFSETW